MATYRKLADGWGLAAERGETLTAGQLVVVTKANGGKRLERVGTLVPNRKGQEATIGDKANQRGGFLECPVCEDTVRSGSECYTDKKLVH